MEIVELIDRAREYVGMRSRASRVNEFGARVGFDGKRWDGSFLETVFRVNGVSSGVSLTSTTAALAYFMRENRIHFTPKPGDLVFFAWDVDDDGFGQPHIGLVSDVSEWKSRRAFRAIEGEVSSGTAKGSQDMDGVYERTRYETDVLAFARPAYRTVSNLEPQPTVPTVRPADFKLNRVSSANYLLQWALHDVTGVTGLDRGRFDTHTRSAVLRYQREIGHLTGNGMPDDRTLAVLAEATNYRFFRVGHHES